VSAVLLNSYLDFLSASESERVTIQSPKKDEHGLYWVQTGMSTLNFFSSDQERIDAMQSVAITFKDELGDNALPDRKNKYKFEHIKLVLRLIGIHLIPVTRNPGADDWFTCKPQT